MNIRIADVKLPAATSTPSGMPDVTEATRTSANAELFWHMLRETVKRYDPPAPYCTLQGTKRKGFILQHSPQGTAEDAWDGLDGSPLAQEILEVLYENLMRSGHLARWTVAGKAVRWWVADTWDKMARYTPVTLGQWVPVPEGVPAVKTAGKPVLSVPVPSSSVTDYHAILQGLLDELEKLKAEARQRNTAVAMGQDVEEMAAEIERLRERCADLTAANEDLRQQKLAYDRILGRR